MKTEVTEQGLIIPKHFLKGIKEVEIRKENSVIVIIPLSAEDPILSLGEEPVTDEITDASVNHDRYIYGK
ncbi:MAG: hypothetical protein M3525_02065 [Acidobacteriota bacterium]|nr:hypothetical protein [Acidobacteriota bacterium]